MQDKTVPLIRSFSLIPKSEANSDKRELEQAAFELAIRGDDKPKGWNELEKEFRCVILAEAGAGKSFEMKARARHAEKQGRAAFLIRIEYIKDSFETALFEVGSANAFKRWLKADEEAWFFLDSIDESRLKDPLIFEEAIGHFELWIRPAFQRAHVFISSRPYAWRPHSDRALVEQHLPFKKPQPQDTAAGQPHKQESALCVYQLDPLSETHIRLFASHLGRLNKPETDRLIDELKRANLMSMAERPFDLEAILDKWESDQILDGRLELLCHNIDLRLGEINNPNRAQLQPLNQEKAKRGARLLAAAVILTGESGIRVPDSTPLSRGIDAGTVLGDWHPNEVQALLERGIFNDVLYGMVRFRHREVRELLAAEWFLDQLEKGGPRHKIESLFFHRQYGQKVIRPRLRPVLPWLLLFDAKIRHKALDIAPEVAVEGGDAARLPLAERQALLGDIVTRIVNGEDDDRSARDNSAIARIAQPDLTNDALRLITKHQDNDDAIFFLGRLVWQGEMNKCVRVLLDIAASPDHGISARVAAARAVMTCGGRGQKKQLWEQLTTSPEVLSRRLLAELVKHTKPNMNSVKFLLASIDKLEAYKRYDSIGLDQALHGFIDRFLPILEAEGLSEPLAALISKLNAYLERKPYIKPQRCHVSKEFVWLLGPATHAVERLVSVRSKAALSPDVLAIMLKVPVMCFQQLTHFVEYKNRLHRLVPAWKALNDALFWRSIEEARARLNQSQSQRLINHWPVQHIGYCWKFKAERFDDVLGFITTRKLLDDKLVALSLAHWLYMQSGKPTDWLKKLKQAAAGNSALADQLNTLLNPVISQEDQEEQENEAKYEEEHKKEQEAEARKHAEWIEHLKATPDIVRHPPGLTAGELSEDQCQLLNEVEKIDSHKSRASGANWKALIPKFGEDVAEAYRDAAIAHWRRFKPGLRSEGHDTSSISRSLLFAASGLEIEAREVKNFPVNLTEAKVRHALRYLDWGFHSLSGWLEKVHEACPKVVLDTVLTELYWELAYTKLGQFPRYILHNLAYFAAWMHQSLASPILAWLEQNKILNQDALSYCIHILRNGNADTETVSRLAQAKIAGNAAEGQRAAWYALWIDFDAEQAIPAAEQWLSNLSAQEASKQAQKLVKELMGTRRSFNIDHDRGNFLIVKHLKALYVLMHRHIRAQDDIKRVNKGVYSPGLRDDAQEDRDALLSRLLKISGKETYAALTELAENHPNVDYRPWMSKLAYEHAEKDADIEPWSAQQVRDYDQYQVITPTTHQQLFDLTVDCLNDLKHWIEDGNDSPYQTWQKADSEAEMRNLVAGWLNDRSHGRYTCTQESELANQQRPDIWMQNPQVASPVPVELKLLDKGWSGPKLCERLRNQLPGDYLREEAAGCGVFLLIWRGRSSRRSWKIGGNQVALPHLPKALTEYWQTVSNKLRGVEAIEILLIDLTIRENKSKD